MAVVTGKSQQISDRDAFPAKLVNGAIAGGRVRHARGVVQINNTDSVGSKFIACSIPSNAVVIAVRVSAPDIGTTTAADVGLYRTTKEGGTVVDADFFASALVLNAGALNKVDVTHESGVLTLANADKMVWQALGLTSDPSVDYDVVLTLTGAADASGAVLVEVDYAI